MKIKFLMLAIILTGCDKSTFENVAKNAVEDLSYVKDRYAIISEIKNHFGIE